MWTRKFSPVNAYNSGVNVATYTIQGVPEPALAALLGMGGLLMLRRVTRHLI